MIKNPLPKLKAALNRPYSSAFSNNVALIPIDAQKTHPVFYPHARNLQPLTAMPLPHRVLHVINWKAEILPHKRYISEPESFFGILPRGKRPANFDRAVINKFIENEIDAGKLLKIVFANQSALKLHCRWYTPKIEKICTFATLSPTHLDFVDNRQESLKERPLTIILIGTKYALKGMFLIPQLIAKLGSYAKDIKIICVSSEAHPDLDAMPGVEVRVVKLMTHTERRELFSKADLHLNLSLGDTLGIFLDTLQYGVPMLSFKGQNAESFIRQNVDGVLIDNPVYYYSDELGVKYNNRSTFAKYLMDKHAERFFEPQVELFAAAIKSFLDKPELLSTMRNNLRARAQTEFTVDRWLKDWSGIYHSI